MAGSSKTPGAVRSAIYSNKYVMGPLSRMVTARAAHSAANTSIKAIWRREQGPVGNTSGSAKS